MTVSPLQFAKDFGKLKSDLASQPAADLKLLLLVDFWPSLERYEDNTAYRSYFDEYIPLLLHLVSEENLHDLTLDELEAMLSVLRSLNKSGLARQVPHPPRRAVEDTNVETTGVSTYSQDVGQNPSGFDANVYSQLQDKTRLTITHLAKMLFYVGGVEEGVKLCAELVGEKNYTTNIFNGLEGLSECNALRTVCARFKDKRPSLYNILKNVLDAWEGERETLSHEQANCLFIEKGGISPTTSIIPAKESRLESLRFRHNVIPAQAGIQKHRGRLRVLEGRVELLSKSVKTDQIAFENQIKSPDDPFIGVAYDSLEAVRQVFKAEGFKDKASTYYHAHFSIINSTHTFTGDSIGLAFGLVTYTQLLKPEIMRQERFLASEVAFTGGVDENGRLTSVNKETLGAKIERAFFSPVKYLVLPESNLVAAKEHLEELKKRYHRRRLHLIGAERFTDVIENHNVVRAEKVCMSEFVIKKVYRYSRMTKVQVPLLAVLLLVLLGILFPKWTPWFDWHIAKIEVIGNRFRTLNANDQELWKSEELEDEITSYPNGLICGRHYWATDINEDGKDELFIVFQLHSKYWQAGFLRLYDKGKEQWSKPAFQLTGYDSSQTCVGSLSQYHVTEIIPVQQNGRDILLLTVADASMPARAQVMAWTASGVCIAGPYLHTGGLCPSNFSQHLDVTGDKTPEIILKCTNNRYNRAALVVLEQDNLSGVSPPFDNELFQASNMPKGSQRYYVAFPETSLSSGLTVRNWVEAFVCDSMTNQYTVQVREAYGLMLNDRKLGLQDGPCLVYILDSAFIPLDVYFPDACYNKFVGLLSATGKPMSEPVGDLLQRLKDDVIVYHGDSIVHHAAAGTHFYRE